MLEIIHAKNLNIYNSDDFDGALPNENHDCNKPVIPVSCESNETIVDWTAKNKLLSGAFPKKNLFGQGVPHRLPTQQTGSMLCYIMMVNLMILYSLLTDLIITASILHSKLS